MKRIVLVFVAFVTVFGPVLAFLPGQVSASSSVTWTSTADFDGGNKGDPGNEWFAQNGADQPNNGVNKPRAWYSAIYDTTYTVWQGLSNLQIFIGSYNHATGAWTGPIVVEASNPMSGDGHGAPSLLVTNDGRIHVFCCAHATALRQYRSNSPGDISAFTRLSDIGTISSYPNPIVAANGTVYLFYRDGSVNDADWIYRISTNHGVTWSSATIFLAYATPNIGVYTSNFERSGNDVYFAWSKVVTSLRTNLYAARLSLVSRSVFSLDGTDMGTSVTPTEADTNARIRITTTSQEVFYPVVHLVSGKPFLIYLVERATKIDVNWTQWNGASWTANATIFQTASANNMGDFRVQSSTDVRAYYPFSKADLTGGGVLYEWRWDGATWTRYQSIMGSQWSHAPEIVRNHATGTGFLAFDERALTTSNTLSRLWLWGDAGFVFRSDASSGTFGVESPTDNSNVATGSVRLASSVGEKFTIADTDARTFKLDLMNKTSYNTCTSFTREIASGGLHEQVVGSGGGCSRGTSSVSNFTGDWTVTVKLTRTANGSTGQWMFSMLTEQAECDVSFTGMLPSGPHIEVYLSAGIQFFDCVNGVPSLKATVATAADPIWLRIARATNTFTATYSTDGAAFNAWGAYTNAAEPNPMFATFTLYGSSSQTIGGYWDDILFSSGSAANVGYRTSGSWTSPLQNYGGPGSDIVRQVAIQYSGVSSTKYIDSVAIVDADGEDIYRDDTNRVSGTSATVNLPLLQDLRQDWSVKVTLAGNGAGTPVLEAVTATIDTDTGCLSASAPIGADILSLAWIIIPLGIFLVILGAFLSAKSSATSGGMGGPSISVGPMVVAVITTIVLIVLAAILISAASRVVC